MQAKTESERLTIYILDAMPGETPEEKAYTCIAGAYFEARGCPEDLVDDDFFEGIKRKFPVLATSYRVATKEWKITIEGSADDIAEYKAALGKIE